MLQPKRTKFRKRMKAKGYVPLTVHVHKTNVAKIKAIVDKINKGDK